MAITDFKAQKLCFHHLTLLLSGIVAVMAIAGCVPNKSTGHLPEDHYVGKALFNWTDTNRIDPYYGGLRIINAQIWYPIDQVDSVASFAAYLPGAEIVWKNAVGWTEQDFNAVSKIKTSSILNHPIAVQSGPYPLLVFSPSLGGHASFYTYYAEALARKGYVVMGISHLYESDHVLDQNAKVYPQNHTFHDSIENLKIPEQISGDGFRELKSQRMIVIAEDIIFALDQLIQLSPSTFQNRIDFNRIGAWGHSIGGAAATYASLLDNRVQSVLNMDGTPPTIALREGNTVPFMFLEDLTDYEHHDGYRMQYNRRNDYCSKGNSISIRVLFDGISHTSFSDTRFYLTEDGSRQLETAEELDQFMHYMTLFFDHTLKGKSLGLESLKSDSLEILIFPK